MIKLTQEEGRMVVYNDHEDWETIETNAVDQSRWSVHYEGVFKHISSGKFYSLFWSKGATEMQDEQPFEYDKPNPAEVKQVERVIKVWEAV